MEIRNVNRGRNRFCGPAAISAITGIDTDEAARLIRRKTGKRQCTGTPSWALADVLKDLGIHYKSIRPVTAENGTRITLARWLKDSKGMRSAGRVFLVIAGNHYQLISGRRYVCGRVGEIVSIRDPRVKRRARVKSVWELRKAPGD